jgi:dolichol-phosphate mannosyltransferase
MHKNYSDLTVVIPTLNEASNIELLLDKLSDYYSGINIIVVDDHSQDSTPELVQSFKAKFPERNFTLRLVQRISVSERGLTASILDGLEEVNTNYTMVMDGDLQHPPEMIKEFIVQQNTNNSDLVIGQRLPYCERQGFHRVLITALATYAAWIRLRLKGFEVHDPMSGFFLVKTAVFRAIVKKQRSRFEGSGYKVLFDLLKCAASNLKISNLPYDFGIRPGGNSKLRPAHALYFLKGLFS